MCVDHVTQVIWLYCGLCVAFVLCWVFVMISSPCWLGRNRMVGWSGRSWLQRTESLVAAHTTAWESWSAGSKTEQSWEEGNMSDWKQQKSGCLSADDFCQVWARHWTPSCVCYMSWALSNMRGCRQEHQGHTWWEGSEVDELEVSQRRDMDGVRP